MREKVCESRFRCEGFPGGKGWGKFGEVSVTLLAGDNRILFLSALPLVQFLVTKKGLGSRVTECLGSPLPPAHPPGFILGQLEPEVAFKQLD